jgi:hypothetical protein
VLHQKDPQCWAEWWVLWRRVAAGLSRPHHDEIVRRLLPFLLPAKGVGPAKKASRPRPEPHEIAEMWRCAASLERLMPETKESLGQTLEKDLSRPSLPNHTLWCLGRLGARVPLFGPANTAVRKELAERWIDALLGRTFAPGRETTDAVFALSQLGRVSGDRVRDIDPELRSRVVERLRELGADEASVLPVQEYLEREAGEQGVALGDSLPVGLRLITVPDAAGV